MEYWIPDPPAGPLDIGPLNPVIVIVRLHGGTSEIRKAT
jgi:hypothetical protein